MCMMHNKAFNNIGTAFIFVPPLVFQLKDDLHALQKIVTIQIIILPNKWRNVSSI